MKYSGEFLREISFPIGGIGTGSIGIAGNGEFTDFEIFNRPNKGGINHFTFFSIRALYKDGRSVTKVLQGDHVKDLIGKYSQTQYSGFGYGPDIATACALPHFRYVEFDGTYPIATMTFFDDDFPAKVILRAYNPFIPHDAENSSLPIAMLDVSIKSLCDGVEYTVVFSAGNPFDNSLNEDVSGEGITAVKLSYAGIPVDDVRYGDLTVATAEKGAFTQPYWYRGLWQDGIATFWRELSEGKLWHRTYDISTRRDTCSIGCGATLDMGCEHTFSFVLSWNIPNSYNYWSPFKDENGKDVIWKNYYATRFSDSLASASYALENRENLLKKTKEFAEILHGSTLDPVVIDAISSTMSVLRSPTVLRLENGEFYGWEGVHERAGSCEGTCTHVWSYAYALCFLFPELERSIRDTEYKYDIDSNGKMNFRTKLPLGRAQDGFRACVDGQMATVFKTYREWKISGDSDWLKKHWATVKSALEYTWSEKNPDKWDLDRDGILEGRQHHTLDMELFGPSSWLEGMYLAALKAAGEMAEFVGEKEFAGFCRTLFANGYEYMKNELFNGRYFIQKIDLSDKSYTEKYNSPEYWNDERNELKYQIGEGCEIDQMLGQWHASLCGLGDIFDKEQRRIALQNMYNEIYKPSLRDHANAWRIYALNDEGGAIMCSYPQDVYRPMIPISYVDECMTGFEYAFAGLLISEGFIEEGLSVVRSIRGRYDGKKRNPYNEIECGSNYARAMASFALLQIFSGFEYDMTRGYIGFSPIVAGDFKCLWSVGQAWGKYRKEEGQATLTISGGKINLSSFKTDCASKISKVYVDGQEVEFKQNGNVLTFDTVSIQHSLMINA